MTRLAPVACLLAVGCMTDFHVGGLAMDGLAVSGMITLTEADAVVPVTATARFYGSKSHLRVLDEVSVEVGDHLAGVGDAEPFRIRSIPIQLRVGAGVLDEVCATLKVGRSDTRGFVDVGCTGDLGLKERL